VRGLDTNVLLRLLVADDPGQVARARAWLRAQPQDERFLINRIVLCELVWTLRRAYRYERDQIADVIDRVLKSYVVVVEDEHSVEFALYLYRTSSADFADCLLGVTNGFLGCTRTATFDQRAAELDEFELVPA
jgi:predicted nucleic-acid-binding protein